MKCAACTLSGKQCKLSAKYDDNLCGIHYKLKLKGRNINYYDSDPNNQIIKEPVNNDDNVGDIIINKLDIDNKDILDTLNGKFDKYSYPHKDILECQCCYGEYNRDECIWCNKWSNTFNHIYCKTCITTFYDIHIKDGDATLCCPSHNSENCNGELDMHDLERIIDNNDIINKLNDIVQHMEVLNMSKILDDYYICPFCQRYGCIIDNNNINNIKCQNCNKEWCKKCKQLGHENECGIITGEFNPEIIEHVVEECISNALLHSCPVCSTTYTKTEGCNLMTCPKCNSYSCYICGIQIIPRDRIKYWHFKGSGSADYNTVCPIYNHSSRQSIESGNCKYNKKRIEKACKYLYKINTNKKVKNEMKKILKNHQINVQHDTWYKKLFSFFY